MFYSIRSERQLVEQIDYNLLFRWFVGLDLDDAVWYHAVFSKNRDRLLSSAVAQQFFSEVNRQAKRFKSDEHFTVDGTLIHALVENRNGLIAAAMVTHADGYAERDAALLMLHEMQKHRSRRIP